MIAPAATFSGDWASGSSEAISIGTTTPPVPQIAWPRTARAHRPRRAASRPPTSLKPTATSNRRRSLPHRSVSDVPEAELHERLLDREVEQRLEERGGGDHRRELRVVVDAQLASGDDRRQKPEPRGRVRPDRRRRAAPDDPGAHLAASIVAPLDCPPARSGRPPARRGRLDPLRLPSRQVPVAREGRARRRLRVGPRDRPRRRLGDRRPACSSAGARSRRMRVTWILIGALMGLFVISCFWRPIELPSKHLTTAAKMIEYALLAPSIVLLLRRRVDVDRFLYVFVGWALAAALWGVLMFVAIVDDPEGPRPGQREVSFLGHQDFGTFTGAALAIGFSAIALGDPARPRRRRDRCRRARRDPRRLGLRLLRLPARHRRRRLDRPACGHAHAPAGPRDRRGPPRRRLRRVRLTGIGRDELPLLPRHHEAAHSVARPGGDGLAAGAPGLDRLPDVEGPPHPRARLRAFEHRLQALPPGCPQAVPEPARARRSRARGDGGAYRTSGSSSSPTPASSGSCSASRPSRPGS